MRGAWPAGNPSTTFRVYFFNYLLFRAAELSPNGCGFCRATLLIRDIEWLWYDLHDRCGRKWGWWSHDWKGSALTGRGKGQEAWHAPAQA